MVFKIGPKVGILSSKNALRSYRLDNIHMSWGTFWMVGLLVLALRANYEIIDEEPIVS